MSQSMLRKLFSKCTCSDSGDSDDIDDQRQREQQLFDYRATRIANSNTETTLASSLSNYSGNTGGGTTAFKQSETLIKRRTPVLFSTNRGLYLRVAKIASPSFTESSPDTNSEGNNAHLYDISFCDLERWSTHRAHTVSLEDTFTIARRTLETVEEHPTSSSRLYFIDRSSGSTQCCGSNSFMPVKRSVRFNNAYSRFETGQRS